MIILDQLLPMQDSLYFHSERDDVSPFYGDIAILPSSVAVLPPGPAETFFMAGVDTIVISGFDAEFRTRSYGSSLQEMVNLNDTIIVAQTISAFLASELELGIVPIINAVYLNSLLDCLAINGTCSVIEDVLSMEDGYITHRLEGHPLDMVTTTLSVVC